MLLQLCHSWKVLMDETSRGLREFWQCRSIMKSKSWFCLKSKNIKVCSLACLTMLSQMNRPSSVYFIYLFMIYFMMLWVSQSLYCWMAGWWMMNWKGQILQVVTASVMALSCHSSWGLRKAMENLSQVSELPQIWIKHQFALSVCIQG